MKNSEARFSIQSFAVHILARYRHKHTGKFGLRPAPGGFGIPSVNPDGSALRVSGHKMIIEEGSSARQVSLQSLTLREVAQSVGIHLEEEFSVGGDTPAMIDPDQQLNLDGDLIASFGKWWSFGVEVIDTSLSELAPNYSFSTTQLWPEHFDVGTSIAFSEGINLGASPGDTFCDEPYLYVGVQNDLRNENKTYWNAPFGGFVPKSQISGKEDALAFFRNGLFLVGLQ